MKYPSIHTSAHPDAGIAIADFAYDAVVQPHVFEPADGAAASQMAKYLLSGGEIGLDDFERSDSRGFVSHSSRRRSCIRSKDIQIGLQVGAAAAGLSDSDSNRLSSACFRQNILLDGLLDATSDGDSIRTHRKFEESLRVFTFCRTKR